MKNFFTLFAVTLFTVSVFAQFEQSEFRQGRMRIGGSSSLDFSDLEVKGGSDKSSDLTFGIEGSYFFIDNVAVDVELMLSVVEVFDLDDRITTLGTGLGARYYLPFGVFAGVGFDLVNVKYDGESSMGTGAKFKIGYAAFLNENVALEPTISYRLGLSDEKKYTKVNGLNVSIALSIYF